MDVNKERDLRYIKNFSKIKLSEICRELKINKENIYRGTASPEAIEKVKEEIKKRIDQLEE